MQYRVNTKVLWNDGKEYDIVSIISAPGRPTWITLMGHGEKFDVRPHELDKV